MALNIKNPEVEALASQVAATTGETKTEAIRRALEERRQRLAFHQPATERGSDLRRFLEREIWSAIPSRFFGRQLSKKAKESILGYGKDGA